MEGIIFSSIDYGETSKIITAFTREKGFISIMARGVKKPKSKIVNLTSPYIIVDLDLNNSKDFYYLKDGEILYPNFNIKSSLRKIYMTQVIFDICRKSIINHQIHDREYLLLKKTLIFLEKLDEKYIFTLTNMFLIKFVSMIGYKPNLRYCAICKNKSFSKIYFSNKFGGIVCQNHENQGNIEISIEEFKYLNNILLEIFENTDIIIHRCDEKKIFNLLINFILYNTEIKIPNSLNMVKRIYGIK